VGVWGQNLVVDFTSSPNSLNDTVFICKGQKVKFTNTSSGANSSAQYLWVINNGNSNVFNSPGPHELTFPNSGNFVATLTINGLTKSKVISVSNFNGPQATLQLTTTIANYSTTVYNGVTIFRRCQPSASSGVFQFSDVNQANYPAGTIQEIFYGNGINVTYTTPLVFQEILKMFVCLVTLVFQLPALLIRLERLTKLFTTMVAHLFSFLIFQASRTI